MTASPRGPLDAFLAACGHLHVSNAGGVPKPYKPAMLLAALLLVRKGGYADNLLTLRELTPVFDQVMDLVAPTSRLPSDRALPFRHLERDGIWQVVPDVGADAEALRLLFTSPSAGQVVKHSLGVRFAPEVFEALSRDAAFAQAAVDRVFSSHARIFRVNGLGDVHGALVQLLGWLGATESADSDTIGATPRRSLLERCVEDWLESHWQQTPFCTQRGWRLPGLCRQVMTPVNTIDLLAYSDAESKWWVIELKRGNNSDAVVGQISRYRWWVAQAKQEATGGVVLTDVLSLKLEYAVRGVAGLELWRYDEGFALERVV